MATIKSFEDIDFWQKALSQVCRAKDRNHISEEEFNLLTSKAKEVGKQIAGFMNYLSSSDIKGPKFINRSN